MINSPFEGKLVRLTALDEKDAEIESRWMHDADTVHGLGESVPRVLAPFHVKKKHEASLKQINERSLFEFGVRTCAENKLVGYARLQWIEWNNGAAAPGLGIGLPEDRGHGYGTDAIALLVRYAFRELNLHRLRMNIRGDNARGVRFLERAGFQQEARLREAIRRGDSYCDQLIFSLLRTDWEQQQRGAGQ
ncbi:MAG TPA: GNAT family protein [Anaerolineae bacterium]